MDDVELHARYRVTGLAAYEGQEGVCTHREEGGFGKVYLHLKLDEGSVIRLRAADVDEVAVTADADWPNRVG